MANGQNPGTERAAAALVSVLPLFWRGKPWQAPIAFVLLWLPVVVLCDWVPETANEIAGANAGQRFCRLRLSGTTVEDAQARWLASSVAAYRFQFERVSTPQAPAVLTGTVTVTNGQKTVTNASEDGQPLDQADPADFPGIEELFSALRLAQLSGCSVVYALYDAELGFPTRCLIDQRIAAIPLQAEGNAVMYRLTALEVLGRSTAANKSLRQ